jgi:serine/threonine-protein kinase LATS1/2
MLQVSLVRHQESRAVFAMKVIRKADILQANHVARVKAEREIMASADSDWIVRLYYSFHDQRNLYFVMQYVPVS